MKKDEFMKRIDARDNNKNDKAQMPKDVVAYPFGAEEILLYTELKHLKEDDSITK